MLALAAIVLYGSLTLAAARTTTTITASDVRRRRLLDLFVIDLLLLAVLAHSVLDRTEAETATFSLEVGLAVALLVGGGLFLTLTRRRRQ